MQNYQREFLALALHCGVLRFGQFTLKSGRVSPYFFNAGLFHSGAALATVGRCYAEAIQAAHLEFDMLFGPAYKGIPLVTATAIALADWGRDVPWCFNRKEVKDHGEGGQVVGAPLAGRVLIIDDVITAGTAVQEAFALIAAHDARPAGVVIALDRRERGGGTQSALYDITQQYQIPTVSIVTLDDVLADLSERSVDPAVLNAMRDYRAHYGTPN